MSERESLHPSLPRFVDDPDFVLYVGDARDILGRLPAESVDCCVTSPPYWGLRDYGHDGQIGREKTPEQYVDEMVGVFADVRRVLKTTGTLWLNLGDSYASNPKGPSGDASSTLSPSGVRRQRESHLTAGKPASAKLKDLLGIPWRVALALQADGWYLRADVVWSKPNTMPESVTDRPTKAHEYVFLLTKSPRYYFDADAVREPYKYDGRKITTINGSRPGERAHENYANREGKERWPGIGKGSHQARAALSEHGHDESEPMEIVHAGRNIRTVWEIATQPYPDAHFATFPEELPRRCIAAGCPDAGVVLDPFMGAGTTALVARRLGRKAVGVELNPEYAALCADRLSQLSLLAEGAA